MLMYDDYQAPAQKGLGSLYGMQRGPYGLQGGYMPGDLLKGQLGGFGGGMGGGFVRPFGRPFGRFPGGQFGASAMGGPGPGGVGANLPPELGGAPIPMSPPMAPPGPGGVGAALPPELGGAPMTMPPPPAGPGGVGVNLPPELGGAPMPDQPWWMQGQGPRRMPGFLQQQLMRGY